MFKKVLLFVILIFTLGSLGVDVNFPSQETSSMNKIYAASTESNSTGHKRGDDWPDKRAVFRGKIRKHVVKIRKDIKVKDIKGKEESWYGSGSGTVIAVDKKRNKSLILTAQHVCRPTKKGKVLFEGKYIVTSSNHKVISLEGKEVNARIVVQNFNEDTCVMEADGIVGTPAEIADKLPPPGARLYTAGAPAGIWDVGVTNIEEGIFAGVKKRRICVQNQTCHSNFLQYSIPTVGGMSGSAVYYKGKIIGLITAGTSGYEHVAWGPGINPIKDIVKKAKDKWKEEEKVAN